MYKYIRVYTYINDKKSFCFFSVLLLLLAFVARLLFPQEECFFGALFNKNFLFCSDHMGNNYTCIANTSGAVHSILLYAFFCSVELLCYSAANAACIIITSFLFLFIMIIIWNNNNNNNNNDNNNKEKKKKKFKKVFSFCEADQLYPPTHYDGPQGQQLPTVGHQLPGTFNTRTYSNLSDNYSRFSLSSHINRRYNIHWNYIDQKLNPCQMSKSTESSMWDRRGVGPIAGVKLHEKIIQFTPTNGTDQSHFCVHHVSQSQYIPDRTKFLLSEQKTNVNGQRGDANDGVICDPVQISPLILLMAPRRRYKILSSLRRDTIR